MTVKAGRPARCIFAGVLNTAFGWLVYSVAILFGAPVWSALIAGILFGIIFSNSMHVLITKTKLQRDST
jgi:putative flippase GtrA